MSPTSHKGILLNMGRAVAFELMIFPYESVVLKSYEASISELLFKL